MMILLYRIFLFAFLTTTAYGQAVPPPALYGRDDLGRTMPDASTVRAFHPDRHVGIFYFLWLNQERVYDNSIILKSNPNAAETSASPPWGRSRAFHFWGKPLYGYYTTARTRQIKPPTHRRIVDGKVVVKATVTGH
jgi:hypothetical protein